MQKWEKTEVNLTLLYAFNLISLNYKKLIIIAVNIYIFTYFDVSLKYPYLLPDWRQRSRFWKSCYNFFFVYLVPLDAPWRTFGYHVFTDDVSKNKAILLTVKHREAYISHLLTPIKKVNV